MKKREELDVYCVVLWIQREEAELKDQESY